MFYGDSSGQQPSEAPLHPHSASSDSFLKVQTDARTLSPWAAKQPSPWAGKGQAPSPAPAPSREGLQRPRPAPPSSPPASAGLRLSWLFSPRACPEGPRSPCHNHVPPPDTGRGLVSRLWSSRAAEGTHTHPRGRHEFFPCRLTERGTPDTPESASGCTGSSRGSEGISSPAPWPAARPQPGWLLPRVSAPRRPGGCTQVGGTNEQTNERLGQKFFEGRTPDTRTLAVRRRAGGCASLSDSKLLALNHQEAPLPPRAPLHPQSEWGGPPLALTSPHAEPELPRGSERPAGVSVWDPPAPTNTLSSLPTAPCHWPQVKPAEPGPDNAPQSPARVRRLRLPGARLARPPRALPRPGTRAPATPLAASKPRGCCRLGPVPQERAPLSPRPPLPASDTWAGRRACRTHLQSHQRPRNQIPVADDRRR